MTGINFESSEGVLTVSIASDLDSDSFSQQLVNSVLTYIKEEPFKKVVLEMSAVQLINSYGIGKILMLNNEIKSLGVELRIKNPSKFVSDTFSLLLLDSILKIDR